MSLDQNHKMPQICVPLISGAARKQFQTEGFQLNGFSIEMMKKAYIGYVSLVSLTCVPSQFRKRNGFKFHLVKFHMQDRIM